MTVWPDWARQHEEPIAVQSIFEYARRPDDRDFDVAIYADGTVLTRLAGLNTTSMTPMEVRQLLFALEFPANGEDSFFWETSRRAANNRRDQRAKQ